jgi:hypothetical protein
MRAGPPPRWAFYRRLAARTGKAKAVTATARKIATLFYNLLRHGATYQDPGADLYEERYRQKVVANLVRKARSLGYQLVESPAPRGGVSQELDRPDLREVRRWRAGGATRDSRAACGQKPRRASGVAQPRAVVSERLQRARKRVSRRSPRTPDMSVAVPPPRLRARLVYSQGSRCGLAWRVPC